MSPDTNATPKTCPICWDTFTASGRQANNRIYCSLRCKNTAGHRREQERATAEHTTNPTPSAAARPALAAQLPQMAAQRDCPHCGGPITIVALLTTPEAARPQMPMAAPDGVIPLHR